MSRTTEAMEQIGAEMDAAVAAMKDDPWREPVKRDPTEEEFNALLQQLWGGR